MPLGSMTKPEPSELTRRGRSPGRPWRLKKSSKNSSKGDPGGTCGPALLRDCPTDCDVEMFTTAPTRPSARSASDSGPRAEAGGTAANDASAATASAAATCASLGPKAPGPPEERASILCLLHPAPEHTRCEHCRKTLQA